MMQKKPDQARRYLQRAQEALPEDAQILTQVSVELSDNQPAATSFLVQALKHADAPLPVDHHAINYLQYRLRDQPQQRMDLLQALFDNGWKSGGLEPTGLWLALATLQADNGRGDGIPPRWRASTARPRSSACAATSASTAMSIAPMRASIRCRRHSHLDELRVSGLLDRALDARMAEFSTTLLMLDRNEEVLALTEGMAGAAAEGESPPAAEAEWVAWLLNSRLHRTAPAGPHRRCTGHGAAGRTHRRARPGWCRAPVECRLRVQFAGPHAGRCAGSE
jgi:hypothetical protein